MKKQFQYFILNVFSDNGIDGGNQLAVVPNAQELTERDMQKITKQFNFSESSFVVKNVNDQATVRIFTPSREIEYAGHPTVGTLHVLETIHRKDGNLPRSHIEIELKGGTVHGEIVSDKDKITFVGFSQKLANEVGKYTDKGRLAELIGLNQENIIGVEFSIYAVTTMKFLIVEISDPISLKNAKPRLEALVDKEFKDEDICVFIYCKGGLRGGDFKSRFFVPLYGIAEDPATGGVQSSFCLALLHAGYLKDNSVNEIVVEQGDEVGRPSKIYDKIEVRDGNLKSVVTGGNCYYFAEGVLSIE